MTEVSLKIGKLWRRKSDNVRVHLFFSCDFLALWFGTIKT